MDALVTFSLSRDLSAHLAIRSDSSMSPESIVSVRLTSLDSQSSDGICMTHITRVLEYPLQYIDTSLSTRLVTIG